MKNYQLKTKIVHHYKTYNKNNYYSNKANTAKILNQIAQIYPKVTLHYKETIIITVNKENPQKANLIDLLKLSYICTSTFNNLILYNYFYNL